MLYTLQGFRLFFARHPTPTTKTTMKSTVTFQLVNNTPHDLRDFREIFLSAMKDGFLHEDYTDLFSIVILKNYNSDGTARMIINPA